MDTETEAQDVIPPGNEYYSRTHILNLVEGLRRANADLAGRLPLPHVAAYRRGFEGALSALLAGFGEEPPGLPEIEPYEWEDGPVRKYRPESLR